MQDCGDTLLATTIKFTCKYPFKIKVTGRTKHFINAFGEEIIIDNARKSHDSSLSTYRIYC